MKVLISDNLAPVGEQILKDAGLEVDTKTGLSPEELLEIIRSMTDWLSAAPQRSPLRLLRQPPT